MQWRVEQAGAAAAVAAVSATGLHLLGFSPWAGQTSLLAFATVLTLIAVSTAIDPPGSRTIPQVAMRMSFAGELATLVYFGALPFTLVALAGAAARMLANPPSHHRVTVALLGLATVAASTQAAGAVYALLATGGSFTWPWQALPIASAALVLCVVTAAVADLVLPRVTRRAAAHRWPEESLRGLPSHIVGAAVVAAVIALVEHRAWTLLAVVLPPVYFLCDAYATELGKRDDNSTLIDVAASADHGVCLVNRSGFVTRWNDLLIELTGCAASRAIGRTLNVAVPALAASGLPRAVQEAIAAGAVRTVPQVTLRNASGTRVLAVTVVPDANGALLVWADVSERAGAEQALRQAAESFALVGLGASDGLWALDLTSQSLQVSARWRELLGLSPGEASIAADEWFGRVHDDDCPGLRKALETAAGGTVPHVVHEHRIRHENGSYRRVQVRCAAARQGDRRATRLAGSMSDVTESLIAIQKVKNAERRDGLTELPSRVAFVEQVEARLAEYKASQGARFAVLYLDLDRFKVVNDSLGHVVGDELLVAVARRLESALRPGDILARLSGDEFAVMLNSIGDEMQANVGGFRLQEALKAPFPVGGREVVATASIGIAVGRADYAGAEELMRDADTAMYHAKSRGKARHELFDVDMHVRAQDRLGLESDLRDAVNSTGFDVHYQPIVSLATRRCVGFESLVRWNRHGKAVSPADFIPMAEELGIIEPLGTWVLQQACQKFVDWKHRFPDAGLDFITVNVSARQLVQQGFIYLVEQTVEQNRMKPADLRLEITETALMDAPQFAAQVLSELREFGVKIYLDDFGTGYSSLSHLHKLPVDALKIDRSFVRGLLTPERPAIVESILALARTLQTNVVAEGIEDERQALELERLGCRHAQGYYFSRPIPATAVEELLASGRTLGAMRIPQPQPARATLLKEVKREIA